MIISTFKSIHKAYVDLRIDLPWEEMATLFMEHHDVDSKHDCELYNMVEFKTLDDIDVDYGRRYHYVEGERQDTYDLIPNTVRRCKNNVIALWGIVLDIDEKKSIEEAITLLDGVEYVLYTTFRHTKENHKFRVVIPFSRPLLSADIAGRQQHIMDTFPGVDNASFTVSQSFYFHSGKEDNIAYWNKGIMIDPYDFEYNEPIVYVPQTTINTEFDDKEMGLYREAVVSSLLSCNGLHYAGKGENNRAVLTLVSICRSIKLTFEEFDIICANIADNTSELKRPEVRRNAWTGWDGDRVRKETRDNFIKEYGGKTVKIETPISEYNDFRKKMEEKYGKNN